MNSPKHVRTREQGREEFFAAYDITIATVWRAYSRSLADARAPAET